jgi:hypothetical protein
MNNLNNQSTDLIGDAYKNYFNITNNIQEENPIDDFILKTIRGEMIKIEDENGLGDYIILSQKEFINKIKTDDVFAKKWGLKIEERELSLVEMIRMTKYENEEEIIKTRKENINQISERLLKDNVPTKLITITYNNKTIESYE